MVEGKVYIIIFVNKFLKIYDLLYNILFPVNDINTGFKVI